MNILHITDYHYKSHLYSKFDQDSVLDKFIINLQNQNIDFVFFTGDLVHNGTNEKHFSEAFHSLIVKLKKSLELDPSRIFICAGNHDVDRQKVVPSLNTHFDSKITNSDELNNFIFEKGVDYNSSLSSITNYNSFCKNFYKMNTDDNISDLYTSHIRKISGVDIGIVTINSAWRSYGSTDEGNLMFPTILIKEALSQISDTTYKILLVHHPLHWFKQFNYNELQNLIHKSFNMMFSGHIHAEQISTHFLANNGIFSHISPAVLTYEKDSLLGYSIIKYDFNSEDQLKIENTRYSKNEGIFLNQEEVSVTIPCGLRKQKQNNIRQKVIGKFDAELSLANELMLNNIDDERHEKFIEMFNPPKLKKNSNVELSAGDSLLSFDFNNLLVNDSNYLVLGKDKSGKTSLLKRIQLHHLKNYAKNGNVPFYLDFNEFDTKIIDEKFDIIKLIKDYFETNYNDAKTFISDHNFRLLVDNFDQRKPLTKKLLDFLEANPKVNFFITANQSSTSYLEVQDFGTNTFTKLYFSELGRREIRSFAAKWKNVRISEQDKVIEKVVSLCKQLEIPPNYWTVSLFLLVHNKMSNDTSRNLYEVLDLCVDEMLNKKYLVTVHK